MLHLERSFREGKEQLSIKKNDQQAHQWPYELVQRAMPPNCVYALDLIKGLGIEKNIEHAQTKLQALWIPEPPLSS